MNNESEMVRRGVEAANPVQPERIEHIHSFAAAPRRPRLLPTVALAVLTAALVSTAAVLLSRADGPSRENLPVISLDTATRESRTAAGATTPPDIMAQATPTATKRFLAEVATGTATAGSGTPATSTGTPHLGPTAEPTARPESTHQRPVVGDPAPGNCGVGAAPPEIMLPDDADPDGELVVSVQSEPYEADPQRTGSADEVRYNSLIFAPLLGLDADSRPVLNAAESCAVSADSLTYTFKIRSGMKYSDGAPVTASNYAYAIVRSCDPDVGGQYAYVMFVIAGCEDYFTSGADPGGNPTPIGSGEKRELQEAVGVRATDDYTLQIELARAANYFPYLMTLWTTYPSRQDLVERGGAQWWVDPETMIGNGPFKLESYTPKVGTTLIRNDNYFRGKPRLARITLAIQESPFGALAAYQAGRLDVHRTPPDRLPVVLGDKAMAGHLRRAPQPLTRYLALDNTFQPFKDPKVRQAIAYALNRELYIEQVTDGAGIPAGSFIPPGIPGYQEEAKQSYDPEKARQLLAAAGYPKGKGFPKIHFPYVRESEEMLRRATFWQEQLKEALDITVELYPVDSTEFDRLRQSQDSEERPDMYEAGWFGDYAHPQNWVSLVFKPGNPLAPLGWENAEFSKLIRQADGTTDVEKAAPLYSRADAILAEEVPVAFTEYGEELTLVKPYVKGYAASGGDVAGWSRQAEGIYVTKDRK